MKELYEIHAEMCKVFSNSTRLEILNLLRDKELSVTELIEKTKLGQTNISQHLSIMKSKGIVTSSRKGKNIYYRLTNPKIIKAFDIEPEMIEETKRKAEKRKLGNVETITRDFVSDGSGLENESVDYVMLFNILHLNNPEKLLREAYRILRRGGRLGIIHWNYDSTTPRGPPIEIRPNSEQCIEWARGAGFNHLIRYDLKPYHYGIVGVKE